jgi:hypothetical protein
MQTYSPIPSCRFLQLLEKWLYLHSFTLYVITENLKHPEMEFLGDLIQGSKLAVLSLFALAPMPGWIILKCASAYSDIKEIP